MREVDLSYMELHLKRDCAPLRASPLLVEFYEAL